MTLPKPRRSFQIGVAAVAVVIVLGGWSNRSTRPGLLFSVACLTLLITAALYPFLTLPFSCTGKASFTSGVTTCYAVVVASGFEPLTRNALTRAAVYGIVACWSVSVVAAYFVV